MTATAERIAFWTEWMASGDPEDYDREMEAQEAIEQAEQDAEDERRWADYDAAVEAGE